MSATWEEIQRWGAQTLRDYADKVDANEYYLEATSRPVSYLPMLKGDPRVRREIASSEINLQLIKVNTG
uniref:Uncharacterized protein n=1 Tax=viral metagenome TaxID=1070528 RepID=A0A6M3XL49_9ZZZZ